MRIDLGSLSLEELMLELPPKLAHAPVRRLKVASAERLRGSLAVEAGAFGISDLASHRLGLLLLEWSFGRVRLSSDQYVELGALAGTIARSGEQVELRAATLDAAHLTVSVGNLRLAGQLTARDVTLELGEEVGRLTFKSALLRSFELHTPALRLLVPELSASELCVDWGGAEFRLEANTADAAKLRAELAGKHLDARGVGLLALQSIGSQLSVGHLRVASLDIDGELTPAEPAGAEGQASTHASKQDAGEATPRPHEDPQSSPPVVDLNMLNGLWGHLHADVELDLSVPIIGRRRATHKPRLTINAGALDYMELESGLATLEDSLIDFSLREEGLILERGLPILPTRGRGKPILIWELGPEDMALAAQHKLRLAMIPRFRVVGKSDDEDEAQTPDAEANKSFALRELSVLDLDASLSAPQLTQGSAGVIQQLTFANLAVQGELHYGPERATRPGQLRVTLDGLRALLVGLSLGEKRLDARLELGELKELAVGFDDLTPRKLKGRAQALSIAELKLR